MTDTLTHISDISKPEMGSGEDAQFVFAKYDYTAQGNQELDMRRLLIRYQECIYNF